MTFLSQSYNFLAKAINLVTQTSSGYITTRNTEHITLVYLSNCAHIIPENPELFETDTNVHVVRLVIQTWREKISQCNKLKGRGKFIASLVGAYLPLMFEVTSFDVIKY